MPRGTPLTPDEIARCVSLYEQSGNYCEVARQMGTSESTVREALHRVRNATRRDLHARAVDAGIREARAAMRAAVRRAREMLRKPLEPRDVHALAQAASLSTMRFLDMKRARLERDKLRLEAEQIRERTRALVQWDEVLAGATPEERAAVYEVAERVRERSRQAASGPPTGRDPQPAGERDER